MSEIERFKKATEAQPFTFRQAMELGVTRRALQRWLKIGQIERLQRGLYGWSEVDRNEEVEFSEVIKLVGTPSAIGLLSALSYYGLTDIIPSQTWVIVPFSKRSARSGVRIYRQRHPNWEVGIDKQKGFWITDIDRTLVESMACKDAVGRQEAVQALRNALEDKKTTLNRILKMAKNLKMDKRIRHYLEALS